MPRFPRACVVLCDLGGFILAEKTKRESEIYNSNLLKKISRKGKKGGLAVFSFFGKTKIHFTSFPAPEGRRESKNEHTRLKAPFPDIACSGKKTSTLSLGLPFLKRERKRRSFHRGLDIYQVSSPSPEECACSGLQVQVGGYVEDVHLVAYGTSTEANCRTLERAHQIYLRWAEGHGTLFAPRKYELIHLTRSPKKFNMEARVDLGTHQISPKTELKVLGLWIDGKLRWGPHIKEIQAKLSSQSLALTKVTVSTWGATLNKARQV